MTQICRPAKPAILDAGHRDDLKLAASKMLGSQRRAFQAAMTLKYCAGSARQAEGVFGWSRQAVELGLHEARTGVVCLSAQSVVAGNKLWEEKYPEVARALWALAQLSMDCKATMNIGDYSRGGKTRGDNKANDHDMGCKEKYTPLGSVRSGRRGDILER